VIAHAAEQMSTLQGIGLLVFFAIVILVLGRIGDDG